MILTSTLLPFVHDYICFVLQRRYSVIKVYEISTGTQLLSSGIIPNSNFTYSPPRHRQTDPYVPNQLKSCEFVFTRNNTIKRPLKPAYLGTFQVTGVLTNISKLNRVIDQLLFLSTLLKLLFWKSNLLQCILHLSFRMTPLHLQLIELVLGGKFLSQRNSRHIFTVQLIRSVF